MVATMTDEQIVAELRERVAGLYRINKALSEQVDRMRPVCDAAIHHYLNNDSSSAAKLDGQLWQTVKTYQQQMAQLAKGGMG